MRTVVMLSWEYPPYMVGGLSRHVYAVSKELVAAGCSVYVLTRAVPGLPREQVEEGVQVIRVQPYFHEPHDFRLWVNHLNFALLEAGIDLLQRIDRSDVVLHAHDWLVAHAAKGLKGLFRLPLVATIHATEHGRHGGIHDAGQKYIHDIEWWLTYEAWRVIVCSEFMRNEVRSLFGLAEDKVQVIPNGVSSLSNPEAMVRRETYATKDERLIFHVGRLVPEKGAGVLLEAVPKLLRRYRLQVVIGGAGPFGESLQRRVRELGLQGCVQFLGWLNDEAVQTLYRHADVVVIPSTYEPFGIVALEAMGAGAPLVVSDVGGLSEIVMHEENGLKAEPGNPNSLAQQIERLLDDRRWAMRLATRAQQEIRQRYAWSQIAHQTIETYEEISQRCHHTEWGTPPSVSPDLLPGRYAI